MFHSSRTPSIGHVVSLLDLGLENQQGGRKNSSEMVAIILISSDRFTVPAAVFTRRK